MADTFIHPTAEVHSTAIGEGARIWQHVVILGGAVIGRNVNVCAQCFIENDVVIGDDVTIKCGVYLWNGVRLADNVFVGPNVSFVNDAFPRSKQRPAAFLHTVVEEGASIGAGATLLGGITIGKGAMVGAGAVVTKSVPPYAIVKGCPALVHGYVSGPKPKGTPALLPEEPVIPQDEGAVRIGIGDVSIHRMKFRQDVRGKLTVGEFPDDIPFQPRRYFLVYGVPSTKTRGEHAHHTCKQFLMCVSGSCAVVVDDGTSRYEVALDSPDTGLYLPPLIWGIQYKFTPDATLLVFASDPYDAADYIRDYNTFLAARSGRRN